MRTYIIVAMFVGIALAGCTAPTDDTERDTQEDVDEDRETAFDRVMAKADEVSKDLDTPEEARAAGYAPDKYCIEDMGVHWIHKPGQPDSHFDTELDPDNPEVVLFVPDDADLNDTSGDRFVAIEYVVVTEGTPQNSTDAGPWLFGVHFYGPMPGHTPNMPYHKELHVFLPEDVRSTPDFPQEREGIDCPEGTTPPSGGHED